jgi:thymidylate synthase (FAD)
MADVRLISEITVRLVQSVGGDAMVLAARQASTDFEEATRLAASMPGDEQYGRIRHAMKMSHSSIFEHGLLTFAVHAPAFVWWEWVRHRFQAVDCPGLSFNLESARYRELEPVFWVPRAGRPLRRIADHKPARPKFVADERLHGLALTDVGHACRQSWAAYRRMLHEGTAPEVARSVLPFNTYYHGWASGNPLAWMHFLSKRTADAGAAVPSYPQSEIAEAAAQVEEAFRTGFPLTHNAWNENGRTAP